MKFHFTIRAFTREDTFFLKGVAILLIVLHNYYRWVTPITGENEFWFDALSINRCWIFLRANPLELFHVFFNFLGHYGVQAFIVISAYGLTLSYRKSHPAYSRFVLHRFDKLYPSLILAGIVFIIFTLITTGKLIGGHTLTDLGIQFTLFANLVPGKAMAITGPWWFYSFIFQFYLVFPLLMWIHRKGGWIGLASLVIIGYLLTMLLYKPMLSADLNPYQTFLGHLPEFCLGIFLASRDKVKLPWWAFLLTVLILAGGNIYRWLWPFANLATAVILVVAIQGLIGMKARMKNMYALITAIGVISMYLFAVHGYLRSPFVNLANVLGSTVTALLLGILFVVVVCGVASLLLHTESAARKWIAAPGSRKTGLARLLLLVILVTGGFALLLFQDYRKQQEKEKQTLEVMAFEVSHNFEEPIPGRWDLFSDAVFYQGAHSVVLDDTRSFSPGFLVDLDSINPEGVYELEISAWLYTADPFISIQLVMEIWDKPTGMQVEWQSEYIRPGAYQPGKWFQAKFRFSMPPEFRIPHCNIKAYAWKPSEGTWYIDDLTLRLKARREP
ncbi:MAG: acyltransferase [Bacteroidota bacterium]